MIAHTPQRSDSYVEAHTGGSSSRVTPIFWDAADTPSAQSKIIDKLFPCDDEDSTDDKSSYLLPKSMPACFSLVQDTCCTATIFMVDHYKHVCAKSSEAELSAFISSEDSLKGKCIKLQCKPDFWNSGGKNTESIDSSFMLEFDDEVRRIKLLTLPVTKAARWEDECHKDDKMSSYQALGVLLIVATASAGISVRSIVLTRKSVVDPFRISESIEVTRDSDLIHLLVDRLPLEMYVRLGSMELESESLPAVFITISSTSNTIMGASESPSALSSRIDVIACPLSNHKWPLFRFHSERQSVTPTIKHINALTDAESVLGACLSMKHVGGGLACTLAVLSPLELKFVSLPPLKKWKGQSLSTEDVKSIVLSDCHPTHSLGEGILVVPIDSSSTNVVRGREFTSHFAVLCQPRRSNMEAFEAALESRSPDLSPGTLESSPTQNEMDRAGPPPQWTATETRNAVLRARRDLGVNTNKTPLVEGCPKRSAVSPIEQCDESHNLSSPMSANKADASGSLLAVDNDINISIASPSAEVLDMSGTWMKKAPSDDLVASPLAGLTFLGDSPRIATTSIRRTLLPPRSTRRSFQTPRLRRVSSDETDHPDSLAHLVLVTVEPQCKHHHSLSSRASLYSMPPNLSVFDAICLKSSLCLDQEQAEAHEQSGSELMFSPSPGKRLSFSLYEDPSTPHFKLTLGIKPMSTSKIFILGLHLTEESGLMSSSMEQGHDIDLSTKGQISNTSKHGQIKSLDIDESDGFLRLRAILTTKPKATGSKVDKSMMTRDEKIDSGLEACRIAVHNVMIPLSRGSEVRSFPASREPSSADPAAAKLDALLNALTSFQSSVNHRLSNMERLLLDNSERISQLEDQISSSN